SVTERFDTSTPSGRLLRNIMLTFAQFERELASERTKDKMIQRAQKGMWNGGPLPFGYKTTKDGLIINSKEAKIINTIYETYVTSHSLSKIYNDLKNNGVKYKTEQPFSKSNICSILRNTVYIGKIKYAGERYQGLHPAIISENLFGLAQTIHKKKALPLKTHRRHFLGGLIKCSECGSSMTPCFTNKKRRGRTKRYYYYRCTKTLKRDWNNCGTRQVSTDRLEGYVFENLKRISLDRHYLDSLIFRLNNSSEDGRKGLELSESACESAKISPEIFAQTLQNFSKVLSCRKGVEKNLLLRGFIKNIDYSKTEIVLRVYYQRHFGGFKDFKTEVESTYTAEGRKKFPDIDKEKSPASSGEEIGENHTEWRPDFLPERTITLIIPNTIHACKRKLA
ncbi:MAG: recombinase family protein, partial [Candidatus Omnitrophica bacterium]|nr:recombinase family protein [Candidatus Omnitrophota bacterium]